MKRVMTGVMVAAAVAAGGVSATAATAGAAEPQPRQDCRTYSGVTRCGDLRLDDEQRACVTSSAQLGMTERRAQVECQAFG